MSCHKVRGDGHSGRSRQQRPADSSWLVVIALLALMPLAVGCTGGEPRSRSRAQGNGAESETDGPSAEQATPPAATGGGGTPSQPDPAEKPADTPPEPPAAKPKRPDDVTKWGGADFKSAKMDRDPKLADAVAHLDQEKFHGRDDVATWLLQLLTLDKPPEGSAAAAEDQNADAGSPGRGGKGNTGRSSMGIGPSARDGYGGRDGGYRGRGGLDGGLPGGAGNMVQIEPDLAREVIAIVGRNNSPTARKGLYALLTGIMPTPLAAQELFSETLYAMSDNPHVEHDDAFFVLATEPEKIVVQPQDGNTNYGSQNVDSARREVLELLDETASVDLRHRLAEYLNDPEITEEWAAPVERILTNEDERNLAAQIVLYQSKYITDSTASQLQRRLLEGSRAALGHLMGIEDVGDVSSFGRPGRGRPGGERGRGGYGRGPEGGVGPGRGREPRGRGRGADRDEHGYVLSGDDPLELATIGILQQRGMSLGGDNRRGRGGRASGRPPRGRSPRGRGGDEPAFDPQAVYGRLAQLLWTDEFAGQLGSELLDADSLGSVSEKLQLLATIPAPSGRQMMGELFDEYDNEPNVFASAGMFGQKLADPSFLIVAKSAYHDKKKRRTPRPRTGGSRGGPRGGRGGGRAPGPMGGESDLDSNQWVRHVNDFVAALGERLEEAESTWTDDGADSDASGEAEAAADDDAGSADTTDDEALSGPMAAMGIRLHKGAEIAAEYHLRWPEDVEARLPGANVAPLEIHYVRMEQEARPSRLASAYRRAAGSGTLVHEEDEGDWYDGLMVDRKTGARKSVDIRLFNEDPGDAALKKTDPRDMIIEILVVKIPGDKPESPAEDAKPDEDAGEATADAGDEDTAS